MSGNGSRHSSTLRRLSSGIDGVDEVLNGGFLEERSYMVRGQPGVGKTLFGLHFLSAGVADDESALFVNLGEPAADIRENAAAFGFPLDDIEFLDLTPSTEFFTDDMSYDIFPADDVEGESLTDDIVAAVREHEPRRVFVDPVTKLRYLSRDENQFRKQVLAFLQFLKEAESTVLFTSQDTEKSPDDDLQFMSDGTLTLYYEDDRRHLEVSKFRGSDFDGGWHAFTITDDGISAFPVLRPMSHSMAFSEEQISSGVSELDSLIDGGIERGTTTIISGPTGVGKTTTGSLFLKEAARRGERSVMYLFEETRATFAHRSAALGIPIEDMVEAGTLELVEIEPSQQSPAEFANHVRTEVEERDTRVVMVDGIDGYRLTARDEDDVLQNIHALGTYFKNMGVTGLFVSEVSDITGNFSVTDGENFSYLADNILFIRYLEYQGELRKAIGVLKKRASDFERSLREFEVQAGGVHVGEPLSGLRGVLQGTPDWSEQER